MFQKKLQIAPARASGILAAAERAAMRLETREALQKQADAEMVDDNDQDAIDKLMA